MAKKAATTTPEVPSQNVIKRKYIRFSPDPPCVAMILTDGKGSLLKDPLPTLVIEESSGGCGLVAQINPLLIKGTVLTIKVGQLPEMHGEIRWIKTFDSKVCYFGVEYKK